MSNQFLKLRRSAVPGRVPTTSSLDFGEIALNTYDGLAFMKKSGSNGEEIVTLGTGTSSSGSGGNITGSQYFIPVFDTTFSLVTSSIYQSESFTSIRGSEPTDPTNPDLLFISGAGVDTYNLISAHGNLDDYIQINVQNYSFGGNASSDIVATKDDGTDSFGYVNMGINGSQYTNLSYVGNASDAYLYSYTNGNLLIGNAYPGQEVIIFNGGLDAASNSKIFIHNQGTVGINTSYYNLANPPSLQIAPPNNTTYNLVQAAGEINNYLQTAITNASPGTDASADIVAYNNIDPTNQLAGYIDMGINSTNYTYNGVYPGSAGDAYLFTDSHHLLLSNISSSGDAKITLAVGGISEIENTKLILFGNNRHQLTGSLSATQGFTGSLFGTASYARLALTASYWSGSVNNATSASYVLNAISSSYAATAALAPNYVLTSATSSMLQPYVLASQTSSMTVLSASYAATAALAPAYILTSTTSSMLAPYVLTSSTSSMLQPYVLTSQTSSMSVKSAATASYADNFTVAGTLTAQTIVAQIITSSTEFITGSTRFGSVIGNTHQFTGSVSISGSLTINGSNAVLSNQTGSMSVATASYVLNAISTSYAATAALAPLYVLTSATSSMSVATASYVLNAVSASYWSGSVNNANTASYVLNAVSSSYAATAALAPAYVPTSITSSMLQPYVLTSQTSSMTVLSASYAATAALAPNYVLNSATSSFVTNAQTSSFVFNSQTSSMTVLSASYAATAALAPNYVPTSVTSSMLQPYVLTSQTSSMTVLSASYAATAALAPAYILTSTTSSMLQPYVLTSTTASMLQPYVLTSTTASMLQPYVLTSQTSSMSVKSAATASYADNLTVAGTLTAQTIVVQTITASVEFVTGSTRFGSIIGNTHQFTGSVSVSGSLAVNGSNVVLSNQTGSMSVATASYVLNAISASFASTASYILNAVSASYAATAALAPLYVLTSTTASMLQPYILTSQTSSMTVLSASYAATAALAPLYMLTSATSSMLQPYVLTSVTSSMLQPYVLTSQTSSMSVATASFATSSLSASLALNANLLNNTASAVFATTGSNIFRGNQTVTGSLFTSGSNTLIGTTTLTGSLNISGSTTQIGNNTLLGTTTLSGSITISGSLGSTTPTVQIYGDIRQSGYHRFDPVSTNIDTTISASYIYVSGSTNDLYFSQNGAGYTNTTRLRWLEGNLYTGLLNGGIITAATGSTTYTVGSGSGIVVTLNASFGNNPYPTVQYINWPNLTASIATLSASYDQSFVAILSDGTIGVQGTPYNDGDYNTKIPIGIVIHQNRSTINAAQTFPGVAYGWKQRSYDFVRAFGPLKISGYTLSPSGSSTRGLVLSGGTSWVDGRNYIVDPNNPSYIQEAAGIVTSKIYRYRQSGSGWAYDTNGGAGYTAIDPTQYSLNGVLTAVDTNKWSIQRVFYFPNSGTKAFYIYYGNAQYANQTDALAAVSTETFSEAPNTAANALYVGYMLLRNDADFTIPASFTIYQTGLFRNSGGAGATGGGGGATTLASLSDVSISSPTNGQPLVYNSVTAKWENQSTLTATLIGNASSATTSSFASTASYVLNAISASYAATAALAPLYVLTSATSSMLQPYVLTSQTSSMTVLSASYAATAALAPNYVLTSATSSMLQPYVLTSQTSSMTVLSASYAATAALAPLYVLTSTTASMLQPYVLTSQTSSMSVKSAVTASYADSFTVAGTLTAQTIVVQTITSSTDFVTGSTRFGSIIGNTHQFTGSVSVSGSLAVNGSNVILSNQTSSMTVATASFATSSLSASFASTSSFVNTLNQNVLINGILTVTGSITSSLIGNPGGDIVLTPMSASINTGSVEIQGGLKWKRTSASTATEIGDLITFGGTMGLIEGGALTTSSVGGLVAQVGEAVMYTMTTFPYSAHNLVKYSTIGTTDASRQITLPQTSSVYVYYNNSGVLTSAATAPSSRSNIILGKVTTDASNIIYIDASQINAHHYSNYLDRLFREALGPIFSSGAITTQGTISGSLNVSAATYFFSQNRYTTTGASPITMDTFYRSSTAGQYVRTTGSLAVSTSSYDSGSGTLVSIPTGKYVKHSLYLLNNSLQATAKETYLMVYGQTTYDTVGDAQAGSLPTPPSFFTDAMPIIASLVVTPASQSIQAIIDERPRLGFVSPSKTGVITAHGDLTGLTNDDHLQYLLVDGTRQMTGNLGLGGNSLYNFSLISGSAITASGATITSITGSLFGTASWATNASTSLYATNADNASTIDINVFGADVDSYLLMSNVAGTTGVAIGGDADLRYNSSTNKLTVGSVSATSLTGSLQGTASWASNAVTSSYILNAVSSSFASTASYILNAVSASYAATASYATQFIIGASQFNNTSSATIAGTTVVSSRATGSYTSCFYNYTIASASNARSGQIMSVWNGGTIRYTEVTTTDIGNTATASFAVALSGANVNLNFTAPGTWTVKSIANLL